MRENALKEISTSLSTENQYTVSPKDVQKKIHGIRSQYFSELNKIKRSKASGAGTNEIYTPKLWCFHLLSFLDNVSTIVSPGQSNLELENLESQALDEQSLNSELLYDGDVENIHINTNVESHYDLNQTDNESSHEASSIPPIKKHKKSTVDNEVKNMISSATRALKELEAQPTLDENETFCQFICSEMKQITDEEVLDAFKGNCISTLFEAKRRCRRQ